MGDEQDPNVPKDPSPEGGQDKREHEDAPESTPGVPPPTTDDVDGDQVDEESAASFPASDPPANY